MPTKKKTVPVADAVEVVAVGGDDPRVRPATDSEKPAADTVMNMQDV